MGYEYDVFISYTRGFPFGNWVKDTFYPFFKSYLENSLSYQPNIFIDKNDISPGDSWPDKIKSALINSKCLVSIWSPAYFRSPWCMKECGIMHFREQELEYRTIKKPYGLILPVNILDGKRFPEFAKNIHWLDFRKHARVGEGFKNTKRYVYIQDKLEEWIEKDVAEIIEKSPPWDKQWRTNEWISKAVKYSKTIDAKDDKTQLTGLEEKWDKS